MVGTLLGEIKDGIVTVTECYSVPFTEQQSDHDKPNYVAINKDYQKAMYGFHRRNNKKEVIVGWYTTTTSKGEFINDNSSLVHQSYTDEVENPIHLVVDTTLLSDTIAVRGFLVNDTTIGEELVANSFQEIKVDVTLNEYESTILHYALQGGSTPTSWKKTTIAAPVPSPTLTVTKSLTKLQSTLDYLQLYVDSVVAGKVTPDREIGIAISDGLNTVGPQVLSSLQANTLQQRYQDLSMISYLATLTQTQTLVAEKLNQIL